MNALYMECSSKERTGVEEIFREAIDIVVANDESNQSESVPGKRQDGKRQEGTRVEGARKKKKRSCRIL